MMNTCPYVPVPGVVWDSSRVYSFPTYMTDIMVLPALFSQCDGPVEDNVESSIQFSCAAHVLACDAKGHTSSEHRK